MRDSTEPAAFGSGGIASSAAAARRPVRLLKGGLERQGGERGDAGRGAAPRARTHCSVSNGAWFHRCARFTTRISGWGACFRRREDHERRSICRAGCRNVAEDETDSNEEDEECVEEGRGRRRSTHVRTTTCSVLIFGDRFAIRTAANECASSRPPPTQKCARFGPVTPPPAPKRPGWTIGLLDYWKIHERAHAASRYHYRACQHQKPYHTMQYAVKPQCDHARFVNGSDALS